MTNATVAVVTLKEIYGEPLLRFLLRGEADEKALSLDQQETESLLTELAKPANPEEPEYARSINLSYRLSHYLPDKETTICWALHVEAGGNLYEIKHDNQLEQHLLVLGRDIWPTLLLPRPKDWPFGLHGPSTFSHPASRAVMQLLLTDDATRQLFPGAPDTPDNTNVLEVDPYVIFSSGHGGGLQLSLLPDMLLMSARTRQLINGEPDDLAVFLNQIIKVLHEVRMLARGEEILVPKLVGLANMNVPSGVELRTPFGTLRSPQARDEQVLPKSSPGGNQVTAVLETTHPLKILSKRPSEVARDDAIASDFEKQMPIFEQYHARGERNVMLMRYSVLLASSDALLAPAQLSQAIFEPLAHGLRQAWAYFVGQPSGISTLDVDAANSAKSWAEKVSKYHPENLDLGVRRLLSAAGVRLDPMDSFIDAVVCWENMFGSTTESTFRICGAMACLLEPLDTTKRLAVFDSLKKLYEARSRVVHGAKELSARIASEHRTQSIRHALEAMRRLYDYPDLLNAKGSAERGRDAMLSMGMSMETKPGDETDGIN